MAPKNHHVSEAVVAAKQTDFGEADETLSQALTLKCADLGTRPVVPKSANRGTN